MLDRMRVGEVAAEAPHRSCAAPAASCATRSASRATASTARTRSCITSAGRTRTGSRRAKHGWAAPVAGARARAREAPLQVAASSRRTSGPQIDARVPLLFNDDVIAGVAFPTAPDPVYFANGDADELIFIHEGGGTLRSLLGDVAFAQGDYVFVPSGLLHRFVLERGPASTGCGSR